MSEEKTIHQYKTEWAGRDLVIEIGKYAQQTNASVTVQYGDTIVLATVVMGEIKEGMDYFPLMVDYEERFYAAGKIKGSRFIKREGRPSDDAILTARLIDRSVRPFFDQEIRNEVQVVVTTLSWDAENDPALLGLIGASCVLAISDIPWGGPVAAASLGLKDGKWVINPTYEFLETADAELFVSGTMEKVVMIEFGGAQIPEDTIYAGIEMAIKEIRIPFQLITKVVAEHGKEKRGLKIQMPAEVKKWQDIVSKKVDAFIKEKNLVEIFSFSSKEDFKIKMQKLHEEIVEIFKEDEDIDEGQAKWGAGLLDSYFEEFAKELALKHDRRVDGRALDEIRTLSAKVGLLPRTHGSGLFSRGETQVLSVVTLGAPGAQQVIDSMEEDTKKRYMHHYNFPGFCVGEVKFMRSPGRREIGHGALVEKALEYVIPSEEEFPYTIRVVSEVLSSNGSSSQASVCGSTLALMDAGVPIKAPVAGIAMGLMLNEETGDYKILTDIAGIEDHAGYMDFKIAGTKNGITAIQLDIKASGLTLKIVQETLKKAKDARLKILETIQKTIAKPRKELSAYAPRIIILKINPDKIKDLIGPGGKMIHEITNITGVEIDIKQDGTVLITAAPQDDAARAVEWVRAITHEVTVGEIYDGIVVSLLDFGAIVEFPPKHDGLVHISEIQSQRVEKVEDVLKVGDKVRVKVISVENGKIGLSIKQIDPNYKSMPRHIDRNAKSRRLDRSRRGGISRRNGSGRGRY